MSRTALIAITLFTLTSAQALAAPITVDQILYDSSTKLGSLSATVDMTLDNNLLTITLTNTSADAAGSGAGVLLTGIGFSLPTGVFIGSGSVNMGASEAIGFDKPANGDVSNQWGYDNGPLHSGMFKDGAGLAYNTVISSMESMTTDGFGSNTKFAGPDYGLASALETDKFGKGNPAIRDSIVISLTLMGAVPADLLSTINAGNVGISFGSPNKATTTAVPEPGSLLLLSGGMMTMLGLRRRKAA
jgi:hypothetical protein